LPEFLSRLASDAAASAGFSSFQPDVCLINRYEPGARMALHQDKDERDFSQPIVSLSLGLPATFLFGGLKRSDRPVRVRLLNGDIAVWGGVNRLAYHGIAPLAKGDHPLTGAFRMNLTFRCGL
jgi:alkylated DNA repair protein (DNA oxidative demethylase)